ncbi:hypothetical protein [Erythrobacter sp. F6033]|uniref:hypothetical protein n=1 Tax=Erythrobacter sp. F6033 TaxID=2926401 RepID=UPI001FF1ECF8|nr:hypothetical protein [Erythrobacter sp. F6033]MCK0129597.1 hypothetical protein [Erythrobacter sp. F6033]
MIKRCALIALALAVPANAQPESDPPAVETTAQASESEFVGRYNGNSFETAMGMEIRADGQFAWGLSVGGLDLRAKGTWTQQGDTIVLTSDPKPVPAEFKLIGIKPRSEDALVHVFRTNGKRATYVDALVECSDGRTTYETVAGGTADYGSGTCANPVAVAVRQPGYNVSSPRFDLVELGWKKGDSIHIEFHTNDLGVADFTGMTGLLEGGRLKLFGGQGLLSQPAPRPGEVVFELRKMPPRTEQQP